MVSKRNARRTVGKSDKNPTDLTPQAPDPVEDGENSLDHYKPKRKPKRSLRGIYFDQEVDEALEKLKNSGIDFPGLLMT